MAAFADTVHLRHELGLSNNNPSSSRPINVGFRLDKRRRQWLAVASLPLLFAAYFWGLQPSAKIPMNAIYTVSTEFSEALGRASMNGMILPLATASSGPAPIYRGVEDNALAYDALLTSLPSERWNTRVGLKITSAALAAGDIETASLMITRAIDEDSTDPMWLALSALVAYRESELEKSESYLIQYLAAQPNDPEGLFNLAFLMKEQDRISEATELLQTLIASNNNPLVVHRSRTELAKLLP